MCSVDSDTLNAPYSAELALEEGWKECAEGLDIVFPDHPATDDEDATFYVTFKLRDGVPFSLGTFTDPHHEYHRSHMNAPVNIFDIVRNSLSPVIAGKGIHHAKFRYQKNAGWAAAGTYDELIDQFDKWRAHIRRLKEQRAEWFSQHACPDEFEHTAEVWLEILFDKKHGGYERFPLLIGLTENEVWMMTNGFTNPPSPRDNKPADAKGCSVELLFHAPRLATETVETVKKSKAFEAITLMGEAFYWRFIKPYNDSLVDLSNPVSLGTLKKHTGKANVLAPDTPFLITAVTDEPIDLGGGRQFTPAKVTLEQPLPLNDDNVIE